MAPSCAVRRVGVGVRSPGDELQCAADCRDQKVELTSTVRRCQLLDLLHFFAGSPA